MIYWPIMIVGIAGFSLLGFVQAYLSDGKKFSEQDSRLKKVIVCLSFAQFPYMALMIIGTISLFKQI